MNLSVNEVSGILIFLLMALQLVGVVVAVAFDVYLEKKRKITMLLLASLTFLLVVQNYAENILIKYVTFAGWRLFFAFLGYVLRPMIIALFISLIDAKRKHITAWVLAGINALLHATALLGFRLVFSIDEENVYHEGPLSRACLVISLILLLYVACVAVRLSKVEKKISIMMPLLFFLLITVGITLDIFKNYRILHWVDYVTLAVVESCVFFYIGFHFALEKSYRQALLSEQRYQMMISQLQPHFIYNTLAAISVIDGMPEKAEKTILDFSQYLRRNLEVMTSSELVTLEQELEHVKKYVDLERIRFGEKINVVYDVRVSDFCLPALAVQMLVENAVKHGITQKDEGGTIRIFAGREGEHYVMTVEDDGVGFDTESKVTGAHFGLNNIRKRLEYTVGGTLIVESEKGKGTTAKIIIPAGGETEI